MSNSNKSSRSLVQTEQLQTKVETWNDKSIRPTSVAQRKQTAQDYEVFFIVDKNSTNQKAFDFALATARNFGAKLVLVYSPPRKSVPDSYLEFAKAEGLSDYQWHYNTDMASLKLGSLSRKADEAGVEWTTQFDIGDTNSIMSSFTSDVRKIVVLSKPDRSSWFRRLITGLFSKDVVKPGVRVMVF